MSKTEDLPDTETLRGLVGYNLKRAYLRFYDDLQAVLAPLGLTTRSFSALATIAENDGVRQTDLARALHIERSGIVAVIDGLSRNGHVERRAVPSDRRAQSLHLTKTGRGLLDEALAQTRAHEKRLLERWSPDGIADLQRHLLRLGPLPADDDQ